MSDNLSISPVALYSLTGVAPLTPALAAETLWSGRSIDTADSASRVDLSAQGRLLAVLAAFRSDLDFLRDFAEPLPVTPFAALAASSQITAGGTSPWPGDAIGSLTGAAQTLVGAFNTLLDNLATTPAGALSGNSGAGRLSTTLLALLGTPLGAQGEAPLTLLDLGITPSRNAAGGLALQLDGARLATAFAAAPANTRTVLANAALAFSTLAASSEAELTDATALPGSGLGLLGTAPPTIATAGLLPNTPPAARPDPLTASAGETPILPEEASVDLTLRLLALGDVAIGMASVPAAAVTEAATATPAAAGAAGTLAATAASTAETGPLAAERRDIAAGQALQAQLGDPRLRAASSQADPAYAAMIAATHLSDFDRPWPANDPAALRTDSVGPVSALLRGQAITDYREAANDAVQRTQIGSNSTRQYWA